VFGQIDFQQLQVVTRLASDLDLGVKVIGMTTLRERDGLAMSSRNVYLSAEERRAAPELFAAMKQARAALRNNGRISTAMAAGAKRIEAAGFALDYFELRHAETLAPVRNLKEGPLRLLVAARIGKTRLIDNIAV
jgi:pantoate--beta-alanine ligase